MNRWLVLLFGAGAGLLGLYVFANTSLLLPTRSPPLQFHFFGLSRYLLGVALCVFAAVALGIATGRLTIGARPAQFGVGLGFVLLGIAFISAPRY